MDLEVFALWGKENANPNDPLKNAMILIVGKNRDCFYPRFTGVLSTNKTL